MIWLLPHFPSLSHPQVVSLFQSSNHTMARKPGLYKSFHTLCSAVSEKYISYIDNFFACTARYHTFFQNFVLLFMIACQIGKYEVQTGILKRKGGGGGEEGGGRRDGGGGGGEEGGARREVGGGRGRGRRRWKEGGGGLEGGGWREGDWRVEDGGRGRGLRWYSTNRELLDREES
jgi:hypothetical protein